MRKGSYSKELVRNVRFLVARDEHQGDRRPETRTLARRWTWSSTFHRHIKTVPQSSEVAHTMVLGDRIGIPALNSAMRYQDQHGVRGVSGLCAKELVHEARHNSNILKGPSTLTPV